MGPIIFTVAFVALFIACEYYKAKYQYTERRLKGYRRAVARSKK